MLVFLLYRLPKELSSIHTELKAYLSIILLLPSQRTIVDTYPPKNVIDP